MQAYMYTVYINQGDLAEIRRVFIQDGKAAAERRSYLGRGDGTVGDPHRAQVVQFELSELILLLNLDKQFSIPNKYDFWGWGLFAWPPSLPLAGHQPGAGDQRQRRQLTLFREFRDAVFEDAGFETNSLLTLEN